LGSSDGGDATSSSHGVAAAAGVPSAVFDASQKVYVAGAATETPPPPPSELAGDTAAGLEVVEWAGKEGDATTTEGGGDVVGGAPATRAGAASTEGSAPGATLPQGTTGAGEYTAAAEPGTVVDRETKVQCDETPLPVNVPTKCDDGTYAPPSAAATDGQLSEASTRVVEGTQDSQAPLTSHDTEMAPSVPMDNAAAGPTQDDDDVAGVAVRASEGRPLANADSPADGKANEAFAGLTEEGAVLLSPSTPEVPAVHRPPETIGASREAPLPESVVRHEPGVEDEDRILVNTEGNTVQVQRESPMSSTGGETERFENVAEPRVDGSGVTVEVPDTVNQGSAQEEAAAAQSLLTESDALEPETSTTPTRAGQRGSGNWGSSSRRDTNEADEFAEQQPTQAAPSEVVKPIAPKIFTSSADTGIVDDDVTASEPRSVSDDAENRGGGGDGSLAESTGVADELLSSSYTTMLDTDADGAEAPGRTTVTQASSTPTTTTTTTTTPPPSRLALSYLYYHALEAIYVKENVTLFVHRARDAAPYGHARLNWLLGVLHAYGIGVPRSDRDALLYYSFAAMEGVPEAHMALGYRNRNGLGVRANCEVALAHYREAADAVAMTYDGSAADLDGRALTELTGARTILSGGGSGGGARLSFLTYRDNVANSDKAGEAQRDLLSLIYQADRGNGQALLTLGYVYLKGSHQVRRDGRKAEEYLKQAAAKGVAEAHGALGNLYTAGDASIEPPLPRDLAQAHHHYRLGAAQRDAISLNGLGFLHAIGYLENDTRRTAAAAGEEDDSDASSFRRVNVAAHPSDFATAARYFERGRSAESIYNLAVLHLYGRGVPQDRAKAQRLFWNAAHWCSVLARWQLAHLLDESAESNPDECIKAVELYKETASYGSWHRGEVGATAAVPGEAHSRDSSKADVDDEGEDIFFFTAGTGAETTGKPTAATTVSATSPNVDGPTAPRTDADYERLLSRTLNRLRSVEENLRLSDSEDGPAMVSLASLVELLSLAETGDAASTWLAAKFVEDYLEVAPPERRDEDGEGNKARGAAEGAVTLMWPSASSSDSSSAFLAPDAAKSELLYYLLQRTVLHPRQKNSAHGAAYLRLGDFFYYGTAPQHGVDMARALEYYRLAADTCHDPQALFNVGFMYQLGLHKAPRATLVSSANFAAGRPEQPETLWMIHTDPPYFITGAPSLFLAGQAAAHAWNRDSASPTSRAVDVYMAWRYYTESLKREGRGWMAVSFALATLNVEWSLRHFGLRSLLHQLPGASSGVASAATPADGHHADTAAAAGWSQPSKGADTSTSAVQTLVDSLTTVMYSEASFVYAVLKEVVAELATLYQQAEQTVLYGAIAAFVLALLVRHHVG
jgi:TPR repeat protein